MARIYKGPHNSRPEPESMAAQKKAKETRLPRSQAKRKVVNERLIEPKATAKQIKGHLDQYRDGMKK